MAYIRVCDLCGMPLLDGAGHKYKIKREWVSWYEHGWEKIECHDDCVRKLLNAADQNRKEGDKDGQ